MISSEFEPERAATGFGSDRDQEQKGARDEETDRKIRRIILYMTHHLNHPLPVARLAALASISPSHFFALFKRRTGFAPIDFFIRLRMQHACQLLDETSLQVKEVAAALGYEDPFYFSRAFKAVNRVAPTEYRLMPKPFKDAIQRAVLPHTPSAVFETMKEAEPSLADAAINGHAALEMETRTVAGSLSR